MRHLIICLASVALFACFISCQKEVSLEYGSAAKGSLQSSAGDCLPKTVAGAYLVNKVLNDSNFIEVSVNVVSAGPYTIFTDSINGYSFKSSGTFAAAGATTVRLKGTGNPVAQGINNFTVFFDSTSCDIAVTVLPAGSTGVATFTMNCPSFLPAGTYFKDTTLTVTNTVSLQVTVTTPGTYSITTNTVNGYSFSKSGTFGGTGLQTVVLQGVGKPVAVGTNNFIATGGTGTCNFPVTVTVGSAGGCTAPTQQGTYMAGTALTSANKVIYTHTYATTGSFTASTNTVNGYSFTSTVAATAGTPATITLLGSGTPVAAGTDNFTVNFGDGTSCSFAVAVTGTTPVPNTDYFPLTANSFWTYNYDTGVADTFKVTNAGPITTFNSNPYQRFVYSNGASGTDFYRKDPSAAYYRSDDTAGYGAQGFTFSQARLDILFLKNTLATGDSLVSNFNSVADIGGGVTVPGVFRIKYKVDNANASLSVNGKNFTNVYQLSLTFQFVVGAQVFDATGDAQTFYYAKGVGLVRATFGSDFQDIKSWLVN